MPLTTSSLSCVQDRLEQINIDALARRCGLLLRRARKIPPHLLLEAFCMLSMGGSPSFSTVALFLSALSGSVVSKQAIALRVKQKWVDFCESVLAALVCRRANAPLQSQEAKLLDPFTRVIVHDSTNTKLPAKMAALFPGAKNQTGKQNATMKIQAVLDLKTHSFLQLLPTPFTRNDQRAAFDVLELLRPGDLLIRDLGYFVLKAFAAIRETKCHILSRLRYGIILIDPNDGTPINLLSRLRRHPVFDQCVLLGKEEQLPVRLVAVKVPQEIADRRRHALRTNRDRRLNPTKEHLAMLDWEIFITTVDQSLWDTRDVATIYGIRWTIEILFKTWKSCFRIDRLPEFLSHHQVLTLIYTRLLCITLFQTTFFMPFKQMMSRSVPEGISILKTATLFSMLSWLAPVARRADPSGNNLIASLKNYCAYEKRKRVPLYLKLSSLGSIHA